MANWFVDATISGGNGTDPASAFPSVLSITWASGDRAWIRRTHIEQLTNSQYIGNPSSSFNSFNRWHTVVGWPNSGDHFYDTRPARGVTVGWDADVASSFGKNGLGYNWPTFIGSTNEFSGILLGWNTGFYNLTFMMGYASGTFNPVNLVQGKIQDRILDNVMILPGNNGGGYPGTDPWIATCGRIILCGSIGTNLFLFPNRASIRLLEIHSKSICGGSASGIFLALSSLGIDAVVNWSSSINYFYSDNVIGFREATWNMAPLSRFGRVSGVRPYSGDFDANNNSGFTPDLRVDDWFGEGPRVFGGCLTRVLSSGEAQHNALPVVMFEASSHAPESNFCYTDGRERWPNVRKFFSVTSGTPVTIYVPVYVDSTATFSLFAGKTRAYNTCRGWGGSICNSGNTIAGSYTNWTGSKIANGSAWLWVNTFTPQETGTFPFDIHFGAYLSGTSGTAFKSYVLFGEPYSA